MDGNGVPSSRAVARKTGAFHLTGHNGVQLTQPRPLAVRIAQTMAASRRFSGCARARPAFARPIRGKPARRHRSAAPHHTLPEGVMRAEVPPKPIGRRV